MIATLIVCLVLVGLISGSTFILNQTLINNQLLLTAQQNSEQLVNTKKAILLYSIVDDDKTYVPLGQNLSDYHTIPDYISLKRKNAFGKPYIYCPFSLDTVVDVNDYVRLSLDTSYNINSREMIYRDKNLKYVVESDIPPFLNVQAIIISITQNATIPRCQDVVYDESKGFYVEGGRVETITSDEIRISKM
ncbi:TPA: hypothetical protein ACXK4S_000663 [Pseudomonas aeruginosa]